VILVAIALLVTVLLLVSLLQAREHPDIALGGGDATLALQLATGLALVAGAIHVTRWGEPVLAAALLAAATGLALRALPAPPDGALLFTLALVGASLAPAAAAHAALVHPGGRLAGRGDRIAVAIGYAVNVGLVGVLLTLVVDPARTGCFACPRNLLLVHADPGTAEWLEVWGRRAAACVDIGLALLVLARLAQRPPAARSVATPVSIGALVVLAFSAVIELRVADGLASDPQLWTVVVAALGLLGIGLVWRLVRAAGVRAALGRLTVAASAGSEDLRTALAQACGDPDLAIVVPHPETGAPLTIDGAPAPQARARTAVERQGRVVAWLDHRPDAGAIPEIAGPAGLTLERVALLASRRLQEQEVRASTVRLVEAGEAERRRLERDLHDGAQQRLLALGLELERARAACARRDAATLKLVQERVAALRDDVRRVAHGIHSVTLAEGGLGEAVLALAADGGVAVEALPARRAAPAVEVAIYRLVAAIVRLGHDVRITIEADDNELVATFRIEGADERTLTDALAHAGARIAALGGELTVSDATAHTRVPAPTRQAG
jgi:signal transduction histidine kinase